MSKEIDINEILMQGNKKSFALAIDDSIRSGVPLVVSENGKIVKIKPQFKYVLVPIETAAKKSRSKSEKLS